MTPHEITEMEWLAAGLAATASKMRRAAALLRAAGDLDQLEKRLTSALGKVPAAIAPPAGSGASIASVLPSDEAARARVGSVPTSTDRSRACAVFDHKTVQGRNVANQAVVARNKTQGSKTTAQNRVSEAHRVDRDIDVVPF